MESVSTWIGAVVGGLSIVVALAGAGRWLLRLGVRQVRAIVDDAVAGVLDGAIRDLDQRVDQRFAEVDRRFTDIDRRFERLEVKVDRVAEVTDLRLRPLEADLALVKQHLLGSSAA